MSLVTTLPSQILPTTIGLGYLPISPLVCPCLPLSKNIISNTIASETNQSDGVVTNVFQTPSSRPPSLPYWFAHGIDIDVPSQTKAHVVTNMFSKAIWVVFQLFFYALRSLFLKPKPPCYWECINFTIQIALDVAMVCRWGWKAFAYLILSTFVGEGIIHLLVTSFQNIMSSTPTYYGCLILLHRVLITKMSTMISPRFLETSFTG